MENYFNHLLEETELHRQLGALSEKELEDLIEFSSLTFEDTKLIMGFLNYDN
ncbi:hypothetical protein NVP1084O_040 [Vibrio phage 1.084.O._10N.261.49.F5]|nr:hypothetical protein NVP1084O_040 [Vibrio phage 1.084.O._10N.261.49.F5]